MVRFSPAAASADAVATRDARGDHDLEFTDEYADKLSEMDEKIFKKPGGGLVHAAYSQFASLLLDSVARMEGDGAPGFYFGVHRVSDVALDRIWATCRDIMPALTDAALSDLDVKRGTDGLISFKGLQRGQFLAFLRSLPTHATDAQRARFVIKDADFDIITTDTS